MHGEASEVCIFMMSFLDGNRLCYDEQRSATNLVYSTFEKIEDKEVNDILFSCATVRNK
ncbi:MAG: hypothetical protein ACI8PB_000023 [Desulforhopalus sp.]|jgi:hypothetical protein